MKIYATCWLAISSPSVNAVKVEENVLYVLPNHLHSSLRHASSQRDTWKTLLLMIAACTLSGPVCSVQLALWLVQQLSGHPRQPRVLFLTCSTQAPTASPANICLQNNRAMNGGVWGLSRVLRLEQAGVSVQNIDTQWYVERAAVMTGRPRASADAEAEQAWRTELPFSARLRPHCGTAAPVGAARTLSGRYAISGGLGGLGLRAAALIVERGAGCVLALLQGAPAHAETTETSPAPIQGELSPAPASAQCDTTTPAPGCSSCESPASTPRWVPTDD